MSAARINVSSTGGESGIGLSSLEQLEVHNVTKLIKKYKIIFFIGLDFFKRKNGLMMVSISFF